jgi:hypothetical protein
MRIAHEKGGIPNFVTEDAFQLGVSLALVKLCGQEHKFMPAASFVDSHNRLVMTICTGELTLDEVETTYAEIHRHPEFCPDFQQFLDFSEASRCHLYAKDLYQLKHAHDPFSNRAKRAVVAPDAVWFGISRMYQLMLNSAQFEVFRSLPEASEWLGIEARVLELGRKQSLGSAREQNHASRRASRLSSF